MALVIIQELLRVTDSLRSNTCYYSSQKKKSKKHRKKKPTLSYDNDTDIGIKELDGRHSGLETSIDKDTLNGRGISTQNGDQQGVTISTVLNK